MACIRFEITSKPIHIEGLAAASPPPTLLYFTTLVGELCYRIRGVYKDTAAPQLDAHEERPAGEA